MQPPTEVISQTDTDQIALSGITAASTPPAPQRVWASASGASPAEVTTAATPRPSKIFGAMVGDYLERSGFMRNAAEVGGAVPAGAIGAINVEYISEGVHARVYRVTSAERGRNITDYLTIQPVFKTVEKNKMAEVAEKDAMVNEQGVTGEVATYEVVRDVANPELVSFIIQQEGMSARDCLCSAAVEGNTARARNVIVQAVEHLFRLAANHEKNRADRGGYYSIGYTSSSSGNIFDDMGFVSEGENNVVCFDFPNLGRISFGTPKALAIQILARINDGIAKTTIPDELKAGLRREARQAVRERLATLSPAMPAPAGGVAGSWLAEKILGHKTASVAVTAGAAGIAVAAGIGSVLLAGIAAVVFGASVIGAAYFHEYIGHGGIARSGTAKVSILDGIARTAGATRPYTAPLAQAAAGAMIILPFAIYAPIALPAYFAYVAGSYFMLGAAIDFAAGDNFTASREARPTGAHRSIAESLELANNHKKAGEFGPAADAILGAYNGSLELNRVAIEGPFAAQPPRPPAAIVAHPYVSPSGVQLAGAINDMLYAAERMNALTRADRAALRNEVERAVRTVEMSGVNLRRREAGFKVVRENGKLGIKVSVEAGPVAASVRKTFYEGEDVVISGHTHTARVEKIGQIAADAVVKREVDAFFGRNIPEFIIQMADDGPEIGLLEDNNGVFTLTGVDGSLDLNDARLMAPPDTVTRGARVEMTDTLRVPGDGVVSVHIDINTATREFAIEAVRPESAGSKKGLVPGLADTAMSILPVRVIHGMATAALAPLRKPPPIVNEGLPRDIATASRGRALAQHIQDMKKQGALTSDIVAAPHIDTIADARGRLIASSGFGAVAGAARGSNGVLRVAILVENAGEADRARKLLEGMSAAGQAGIEVIDISQRGNDTIAAYTAGCLGGIDPSGVGIAFMDDAGHSHRTAVEQEFVNLKPGSGSAVLLIAEGSRDAGQTAYINVVNVISSMAARGTSFLGLGWDEDRLDNEMAGFAARLKSILNSMGAMGSVMFRKAGEAIGRWIDSVSKVSVSA
jgi:hypothetical protein